MFGSRDCLSRRRYIRSFDESHQTQQLAAYARQTRFARSGRAASAASAKPSARAFKRRRFSFERVDRIRKRALSRAAAQVFEL